MGAVAGLVVAVVAWLAPGLSAQSAPDSSGGLAIQRAGKWEYRCAEPGCLMTRKTLVAERDHSGGAISDDDFVEMSVAIEPGPRKIAYVAFKVPLGSDVAAGVTVTFIKSIPLDDQGKLSPTPELGAGATIPILGCDETTCVAMAIDGKAESIRAGDPIDLVEQFMTNEMMYILFRRAGKIRTSLDPLFVFQRDYNELMQTEPKSSP